MKFQSPQKDVFAKTQLITLQQFWIYKMVFDSNFVETRWKKVVRFNFFQFHKILIIPPSTTPLLKHTRSSPCLDASSLLQLPLCLHPFKCCPSVPPQYLSAQTKHRTFMPHSTAAFLCHPPTFRSSLRYGYAVEKV